MSVRHCTASYKKSPAPTESCDTCNKRPEARSVACGGSWWRGEHHQGFVLAVAGNFSSKTPCCSQQAEVGEPDCACCPSVPLHPWQGEEKSLLHGKQLITSTWVHRQDPRNGGFSAVLSIALMLSRRGRRELLVYEENWSLKISYVNKTVSKDEKTVGQRYFSVGSFWRSFEFLVILVLNTFCVCVCVSSNIVTEYAVC